MTTEPIEKKDQEQEAAPAPGRAVGSPRTMLVAAAVPSALSLVWTAWSISDMIPAPLVVGLAAGIALDVALVAAIAIAWTAPSAARAAQAASWVIAAVAAAAIGVHSWAITPGLVVMAAVPLAAKWLWGIALTAHHARLAAEEAAAAEAAEEAKRAAAAAAAEERRRAQEEQARAARLSSELTEEQKEELAGLDREAAYIEALAEREIRVDEARAMAAQAKRLAEIERDAQVQRATFEAAAQLRMRRAELEERMDLSRPLGRAAVPDDLSGLDALPHSESPMGFGAALAAGGGGTGSDLGVPPGASPGASPDASRSSGPQRLLDYLAEQRGQASVKGAARTLGVDPRTVRRYRDALEAAGHDVSPLYTDR